MAESDDRSEVVRRAAHRPSRRNEIVAAATNVFARVTYGDATVEDIAVECGVAPTAVYYHFVGKEELFDRAFETCLLDFSATVDSVRANAEVIDESALREVINAGWAWWRTHPVEARLLARHLNGATPQSRRMYQAWQERHAQRAFEDWRGREPRRDYAKDLLAIQFVSALLPIAQTALNNGPLSRLPVASVEQTLAELIARVILGAVVPGDVCVE